jgi:iron(III) transport system substrate-binding protein
MVSRQQFLKIGTSTLAGLTLALVLNSCVVQEGAETTAGTETTTVAAGSGSEAAGEITVYTAIEDDQLEGYLAGFKEAYPDITVNIVRDSTGIVTAKLLAEKDNPQADVVWGLAASSLVLADQQGLLEPYAPEGLDKVQAKFRDAKNPPIGWVSMSGCPLSASILWS